MARKNIALKTGNSTKIDCTDILFETPSHCWQVNLLWMHVIFHFVDILSKPVLCLLVGGLLTVIIWEIGHKPDIVKGDLLVEVGPCDGRVDPLIRWVRLELWLKCDLRQAVIGDKICWGEAGRTWHRERIWGCRRIGTLNRNLVQNRMITCQ